MDSILDLHRYIDDLEEQSVSELTSEAQIHLRKAKAAAEEISRKSSEKGTSISYALVAQRLDDILTTQHSDESR